MEGILAVSLPIFICVVLPVSIVLIVALSRMYTTKKRSEVILRAIEYNNNVDVDKLAAALQKNPRTPAEILNRRLLSGSIFSFVGLILVICGIINGCNGGFDSDSFEIPMLFGGISIAIGASFLLVWQMTRKSVDNNSNDHE